jgi:hypothetical protein
MFILQRVIYTGAHKLRKILCRDNSKYIVVSGNVELKIVKIVGIWRWGFKLFCLSLLDDWTITLFADERFVDVRNNTTSGNCCLD